ncbi:HAD-IB family hydrolase [Marivirga sp. S37H4]|uniref:HAD-IB family hydrolase n=1 Tax=Marivirga aurantiaca TaxID=2802615 RepID=A0A935CAC3_9BACT|nr:HAD-IB family hydrolase [Marivirga aurantiaca]MBK6266515.1 HAD-IB family hydrolase [Marivirga aurantiaca]
MKKNLALFDFDGTITKKDSLIEFLKFYFGKKKTILGFLSHSHLLVAMKMGIVANALVKEKILTYFFKGEPVKIFKEQAIDFSFHVLPQLVRMDALAQIKKHQKEGDRVIVISASAEDWLRPWCDANGLETLATKLEKKAGKLTGRIAGKNCNGAEKVKRILELLKVEDYESIYAYGDSKGDKEMLEISSHPVYRKFKK